MSSIMNKFLLLFLFLIIYINGIAQVNDAGLWTSINIEKKIVNGFTAGLTEEFRFNENVSELGTFFTEIGIAHKLIKKMTAGVSYRFIQNRNLDDSYNVRHRLNLELAYRFKFHKISASIRERFQSQVKEVQSSDAGFSPINYLRSKISIKYDLKKKITPWLSFESFYQLNNAAGNEIDNLRYALGFDYKINKQHSISLFYLINKEMNVNHPTTSYNSGISYTYSF